MDFKDYMKRSFLEHIEHLNEYNVTEKEFFEVMRGFITSVAIAEADYAHSEVMGYADYLMNKLHDYAGIQKAKVKPADAEAIDKGIELKVGESLTVKAVVEEIKQTPAVAEMVDNLKDGEALITFVLDGVEYPQQVGEAYECLVDAGII
ncbi:TPA: hypothetical protein NOU44_000237 [Salmonella enterica subsp. enterica serovar Infantis]|nr:hypothetical protein [Salmonella enterica subsp. enterica serovar Infantis]